MIQPCICRFNQIIRHIFKTDHISEICNILDLFYRRGHRLINIGSLAVHLPVYGITHLFQNPYILQFHKSYMRFHYIQYIYYLRSFLQINNIRLFSAYNLSVKTKTAYNRPDLLGNLRNRAYNFKMVWFIRITHRACRLKYASQKCSSAADLTDYKRIKSANRIRSHLLFSDHLRCLKDSERILVTFYHDKIWYTLSFYISLYRDISSYIKCFF